MDCKWKSKIRFKDLLQEYNLDADELEEIKRIKPIWELRFNSYPELADFIVTLQEIKTLSQFNKWLASVYDYSDLQGIWVE